VLVYVGEYDVICNWPGNLNMALNLEWTGQTGFRESEFRAWDVDGENAGRVKGYEGLTFVTVKGAGHMVS
jgi:carboxypeptidase C (cathepsin A)